MSRALHKDRRFTEERGRMYLAEILLALEFLHKKNIIYPCLESGFNYHFDEVSRSNEVGGFASLELPALRGTQPYYHKSRFFQAS